MPIDKFEEQYRNLISAIFVQAMHDASSRDSEADSLGAKLFIHDKNPWFQFYCKQLDLDPVRTATLMQQKIKDNDVKTLYL